MIVKASGALDALREDGTEAVDKIGCETVPASTAACTAGRRR
jgi:hypothetical protein